MALPEKIWQALPGSQSLFLQSPIREVCFAGTRGPGKSDAMLMGFAQHCGKGYGDFWRGVIFRRQYKHLDDLISRAKRWFFRSAQRPRFLAGNNHLKWIWPTGEELLLRAFERPDDYWDYHGHEYPYIGWEELTSWPSIDCYESMKSCSRSSYQPRIEINHGLPIPIQIRSSTNPYGVGHNWVKKHFIDPAPYGHVINDELGQRVCLFGSIYENPYLPPEYVRTLESIADPNKRKAWLKGAWDITSGGMFDDLWDARKHELVPFEIPRSWKIDRSFDWGSSKPFSCGWWAESDGTEAKMKDGSSRYFARGSLIRIGEWYGCSGKPNEGLRMTAAKVGAGIIEREIAMGLRKEGGYSRVAPGPADPSIYAVLDEESIGSKMESAGCYWVPADNRPGSRKNGWELMRDRMEAVAQDETDRPGIYTFNTCRDFIRTVPGMPRSSKDPDDVDTEAEDHAGDESRYRVLSSDHTMLRMVVGGA